jgi:hypothetical protein
MAMQGYKPQSDHITRTEHLCKHCGSWINDKGYLDDTHRTKKAVYCVYCNTAEKRREMDKENEKIKKERGVKK